MKRNKATIASSPRMSNIAAILLLGMALSLGVSAQEVKSKEKVITLAKLSLGVDHTAEFLGFPGRDEVAYIEIGKGGEAEPFFDQLEELSTLTKFLILAPEDSPLPRMLVDSERSTAEDLAGETNSGAKKNNLSEIEVAQLTAERGLVEVISGVIEADLGSTRIQERFSRYADAVPALDFSLKASGDFDTDPWNCANGSATFANNFCNGSGGTAKIHFCDAGAWLVRPRESYLDGWRKRKFSFAITAACNDLVDVTHFWWNGTSWKKTLEITSLPSGFWMWSRYQGNGKYYRRVVHTTVFHTGFLRAYTAFYN